MMHPDTLDLGYADLHLSSHPFIATVIDFGTNDIPNLPLSLLCNLIALSHARGQGI
jgi:hypothetical protein